MSQTAKELVIYLVDYGEVKLKKDKIWSIKFKMQMVIIMQRMIYLEWLPEVKSKAQLSFYLKN